MRHRGAHAVQAAMLAAKIVMSEEHRQRGAVVRPFLAKAVGESAHTLAERANRAVHPLHVRSAYPVLLVNVAVHRGFGRAYYFHRRISPHFFGSVVGEYLCHYAVVNAVA